MKQFTFFILSIVCGVLSGYGQSRNITITLIDERLDSVYSNEVKIKGGTVSRTMDFRGPLQVSIPDSVTDITIRGVGYEEALLHLRPGCDHLEVILMFSYIYDFITIKQIDRRRKRRYNKLPALYQQAFQKGVFKSDKQCFDRELVLYSDR
mgnify:CR=1 FL=1